MVHPGGLPGLRLALWAVAEATLSSLVLTDKSMMSYRPGTHLHTLKYGASGRIRTSDRSVRSRVLYPAELRMHYEILVQRRVLTAHHEGIASSL